MVIAIDNIDNNHHRRHLVHLFMALPYRFFKKTRNRVEKEKANIDINLDEGEEEFKTLPEYYTTEVNTQQTKNLRDFIHKI